MADLKRRLRLLETRQSALQPAMTEVELDRAAVRYRSELEADSQRLHILPAHMAARLSPNGLDHVQESFRQILKSADTNPAWQQILGRMSPMDFYL